MSNRKIRIVVLEDDEGIKSFLQEVFKQRGYEVFCFKTPVVCPLQLEPECRCSEKERCADIILSDIKMPFIDGLQFIEDKKSKNCKVPYLAMMSGYWSEEKILKAKDLGCKVFKKPFKLSELNSWLDEIENNINLEVELRDWFRQPTDKV